ncbi:hypothetical protein [Blastococcus saxobsidens]|uniref:Uncharacterized protein n=1 Tax=Blastococcus saxobsidens TaxID=138336 RepID=A0A4V2G2E8_9ACTN|nr:hypothetical protein [Blastococcus saxobsidens]RZU32856.1 hypothetical protein BKA19_2565 [Blastococcus saxobsidens]
MEQDGAVARFPDGEPRDWTWPPYAPVEVPEWGLDTDHWAPPTCVRRPWVRVGRWTLLYRRAA